MSWLLLTNDDGVDSPALAPFARALARRGQVRTLVPDRERSWISKAITRFDPVEVRRTPHPELEVWTTSGYPADGVQLGIHTLFDSSPQLVVSGINLGHNHGAGFLLSSGTVGAAVEAWLSGVPAVAFSTGLIGGDFAAWRAHASSPAARAEWERLAALSTDLLAEVEASGLLDLADVVNVNVPYEADATTPRRVTSIARVSYDRLFQPLDDGRYVHDFAGGFVRVEPLDGSDVAAAHAGAVAITPVRLPEAPEVPDAVRRRLERG